MTEHTSGEPSRVVLIGAEFEENLSLRYLAASVARAGWDVILIPFNEADNTGSVVRQVCDLRPSVVGISVPFQLRAKELLSVATHARACGYTGHITVGGHFVTFEYENVLRDFPAIDSVVRHEGEITFRELCAAVGRGDTVARIPGTVTRDNGGLVDGGKRILSSLDDVEFPDRRGLPRQVMGINCAPMIGSRGCYADCSFCCIYAYAENANGARYRRRSPANIVEEMRRVYHTRGVRLFVFHDDNFFVPSERLNIERYSEMKALMDAAGIRDVGLVIKCRPNDVHPALFELLRSMGMIRAYVGIETNSDEGVVSLNRRITSEDNRRALQVLRDLDVYCSYNVLIFDPEATIEGVECNLDFMYEFSDVPFNFCRAEVYAGTPLKAALERQRRLEGDYFAWGYEMRDPRVELVFRVATTAFAARNFRPDGIANLNLGIRFDNEVMRHFAPDCWDSAWHQQLVDFSIRVGHHSVEAMRAAVQFVQTADLYDHATVKAFTRDLARHVACADLVFLRECKAFRREMERRMRSAGAMNVTDPAEREMPWTAETLRLRHSVGRDWSSEILPPPPGVEVN